MDAIEFMKEKKRMCKSYSGCTDACLLRKPMYENGLTCLGYCFEYPEKAVDIVEKWSKEHPRKTRQSEFLKMFPNAKLIDNEIIFMCPQLIDETYKDDKDCLARKCYVCKKEYWLEEVE